MSKEPVKSYADLMPEKAKREIAEAEQRRKEAYDAGVEARKARGQYHDPSEPRTDEEESSDEPRPRPPERREIVAMLPDFDGETYLRGLDHAALGKQLLAVGRIFADGRWHTLRELSERTGYPEASVSARLRDLRKGKFGGNTVERERGPRRVWRYRLRRG